MPIRTLFLFLFLLPYWNPKPVHQTPSNFKVQNSHVWIVEQDKKAGPPNNCDLEKLKGLTLSPVEYPGYDEPVEKVLPEYPHALKERGIAGKVSVTIWYYDRNVVLACAYSGPKDLRPLVEKAVIQWKFKPATFGNEKVCSRTVVTFNFVP